MNTKIISIVLLVVGIMLLIWGNRASDSINSDMSRFLTGSPTDKTVWFYMGGIIATMAGLLGLFRWPQKD